MIIAPHYPHYVFSAGILVHIIAKVLNNVKFLNSLHKMLVFPLLFISELESWGELESLGRIGEKTDVYSTQIAPVFRYNDSLLQNNNTS
jgi:hypothetical protein